MVTKQLTVTPKLLPVRTPWLILSIAMVATLMLITHHALWRDEFNPWLIVRDSPSWSLLWQNVRYEGHPILWYACLSGLHKLTQNVVSMQLFHWGIGFGAILLIWRYSPFSVLVKTLITFGYFPFYEYLIISRNYVLGFFFACLFCALFSVRKTCYWPLALILGLMANSHAYALLISAFLALMLAVEFVFDRSHRQTYGKQSPPWDLVLSLVLFVGLFALAAYCISPPADSSLYGGREVFEGFDFHRLLVAIGKISGAYFFLIPNSSRWFDLVVTDAIILGVLLIIALKLSRQPLVCMFFSLSTLCMTIVMFYLKDLEAPRHMGGLYIILITSIWLASYFPDATNRWNFKGKLPWNLVSTASQLFKPLLVLVLTVHVVYGAVAIVERELVRPYSASRITTNYIFDQGLQDKFIIASRDAHMAPISGYLKRVLYYPELQDWGSFTLFRAGRHDVDHGQVLEQAISILQSPEAAPGDILLVLQRELDSTAAAAISNVLWIQSINRFEHAYTDEKYFLYSLSLQ